MSQSTPQPPQVDLPAGVIAIAVVAVILAVFLIMTAVGPSSDGYGTAPYSVPTQIVTVLTPTP